MEAVVWKVTPSSTLQTSHLNASKYSNSVLVADYAAPHGFAMVAEGNVDGIINHLGNTTRAEAAVIMNRILNK